MINFPALPQQSVPPIDDRGGDATLKPLFSRNWWLYFYAQGAAVSTLNGQIDVLAGQGWMQSGTHAARLLIVPASLPAGSTFIETDRNNLVYQVQGAGSWVYVSGTYSRTQSQVAALVATLTAADVGMRIYVSDYAHTLWCTAAATVGWAPEDDKRAGEITYFDVAPTGVGWKLIDGLGDNGGAIGAGNPIAVLKSDGTTRNNTTAAAQNAGVFLRGAAAYNGAVTAKTVPTISTPTITAEPTVSAPSATVAVQSGAGTTVATATHIHTLSGGTISTPTATLPGPPVDFSDALPYLRK